MHIPSFKTAVATVATAVLNEGMCSGPAGRKSIWGAERE